MKGGPRIQGLDGLRAVSIALVLLGHLKQTRGFALPQWALAFLDRFELGILGVRVFFVISGFLITTLLVGEFGRTGTVSLARFYFRRTLRIFPPYYLYVLVIAALAGMGSLDLRSGDVWHALTYTVNYHRDRAWHLGHAWSLSVEEQFYLLWPALFRALGPLRSIHWLLVYVAIAPLWRVAVATWMPEARIGIGETFFTTADSIATGCLLALLRPQVVDAPAYRACVDSRWFYLLPPVILALNALNHVARLDWLVGTTLQNLLIGVVVERLTRDSGWMSRVLNHRPLVLLGLWSYSVYLWQQPFLNIQDHVSAWTAFPLNILLVFPVAALSYYAVERPALRLRERLEPAWFGSATS